jgi:hypothetical protein
MQVVIGTDIGRGIDKTGGVRLNALSVEAV